MADFVLPELVPVDDYNIFEGKLAASVRWLITRVFEREVPDLLKQSVCRDEQNRLQLNTSVLTALTNGSLYGQAGAKIFKDPRMVMQPPSVVIHTLAQHGVVVALRIQEGGTPITEEHLTSVDPFIQSAHVAMVDALMIMHVRSIISIERTIDAVSRYTSVEDQERPLDAPDALLFWINKICLLVRDDIEKTGQPLKGGDNGQNGVIPEMEDLYEDACDGCCLCALVSFYRPHQLDMADICFNEPMSVPDCQYNLLLLQHFCASSLPYNPWHFETEDVLYMHEFLQPNINAFLADLFEFFEPVKAESPQVEQIASPRRFVPIQGIPDLRAANIAARSAHPPRVSRFPMSAGSARTPRSMSMMSADSLMGAKQSPLSSRAEQWGGAVTNFGQLQQGTDGNSNGNAYSRSDSLPAASIRLALEEKRREHEKKKALLNSMSESERAEKGKAAFFALMALQGKKAPDPSKEKLDALNKKVEDLQAALDQITMEREGQQHIARATSQPSIFHELSMQNGGMVPQSARGFSQGPSGMVPANSPHTYAQPYTQNEYYYTPGGQQPVYPVYDQHGQPYQGMRSSLSNGVLNFLPHQGGQVLDPYGMQQQMPTGSQMQSSALAHGFHSQKSPGPFQNTPQQFGTPNVMHQSAHGSFSLHRQATPLRQPPDYQTAIQAQPAPIPTQAPTPSTATQPLASSFGSPATIPQPPPPSSSQPHQQMFDDSKAPQDGNNTFRLHSANTTSRLDPSLELNRNLTNWGLTYKQGQSQRPQRRTWENETFIKSELDLVNQPDHVPYAPAEDEQKPMPVSSHFGSASRSSRSREETPASQVSSAVSTRYVSDSDRPSQYSPPRDPSTRSSEEGGDSSAGGPPKTSSGGQGFVVEDEAAAQDFDKIAEQRRAAKREALLAKTMKRKEEIVLKVDSIEARNAEKRAAEMAKQEMAEKRKIEKEIQRQKILEDYKKKKMEKELGLEVGGSGRGGNGNSRGSSQPPFVRTKSQVSEAPSTPTRVRGASNVDGGNRIFVPSTAEPTLKLFAKPVTKSNRSHIINALQYSVFPGAVSSENKNKVLGELAKSDSKHFLLLFRDQKCQYRGLYSWDQSSDTALKIAGTGPKVCKDNMMKMMFKYDSGSKSFSHIPTKHLSATIDGFSLHDQYWQKPKIPHSAGTHREN